MGEVFDMVRKEINRKGEVEYCKCYHCRRCDTANDMCHCDIGKCSLNS